MKVSYSLPLTSLPKLKCFHITVTFKMSEANFFGMRESVFVCKREIERKEAFLLSPWTTNVRMIDSSIDRFALLNK